MANPSPTQQPCSFRVEQYRMVCATVSASVTERRREGKGEKRVGEEGREGCGSLFWEMSSGEENKRVRETLARDQGELV